ncbi:hypothetical protein IPM19_03365 [bacterium]|nr:MAG: hypothetical protein IPM19_03365 [bacterium]
MTAAAAQKELLTKLDSRILLLGSQKGGLQVIEMSEDSGMVFLDPLEFDGEICIDQGDGIVCHYSLKVFAAPSSIADKSKVSLENLLLFPHALYSSLKLSIREEIGARLESLEYSELADYFEVESMGITYTVQFGALQI